MQTSNIWETAVAKLALEEREAILREKYVLVVGSRGDKSKLIRESLGGGCGNALGSATVDSTSAPLCPLTYICCHHGWGVNHHKAHAWDLDGGSNQEPLTFAPLMTSILTQQRLPRSAVILVLDLARPLQIISTAIAWVYAIGSRVAQCRGKAVRRVGNESSAVATRGTSPSSGGHNRAATITRLRVGWSQRNENIDLAKPLPAGAVPSELPPHPDERLVVADERSTATLSDLRCAVVAINWDAFLQFASSDCVIDSPMRAARVRSALSAVRYIALAALGAAAVACDADAPDSLISQRGRVHQRVISTRQTKLNTDAPPTATGLAAMSTDVNDESRASWHKLVASVVFGTPQPPQAWHGAAVAAKDFQRPLLIAPGADTLASILENVPRQGTVRLVAAKADVSDPNVPLEERLRSFHDDIEFAWRDVGSLSQTPPLESQKPSLVDQSHHYDDLKTEFAEPVIDALRLTLAAERAACVSQLVLHSSATQLCCVALCY